MLTALRRDEPVDVLDPEEVVPEIRFSTVDHDGPWKRDKDGCDAGNPGRPEKGLELTLPT